MLGPARQAFGLSLYFHSPTWTFKGCPVWRSLGRAGPIGDPFEDGTDSHVEPLIEAMTIHAPPEFTHIICGLDEGHGNPIHLSLTGELNVLLILRKAKRTWQ